MKRQHRELVLLRKRQENWRRLTAGLRAVRRRVGGYARGTQPVVEPQQHNLVDSAPSDSSNKGPVLIEPAARRHAAYIPDSALVDQMVGPHKHADEVLYWKPQPVATDITQQAASSTYSPRIQRHLRELWARPPPPHPPPPPQAASPTHPAPSPLEAPPSLSTVSIFDVTAERQHFNIASEGPDV